ncbi:MAG: hypothetical protein CMD83_18750 [Gammaproteobacteria bacterium]|nr:hypothetical protein [Gammaproteobacteria bacterium]
MSAGRYGQYASDDSAWLDTSAGGSGASNAELRNFAHNAAGVPAPAPLLLLGMALVGVASGRRTRS